MIEEINSLFRQGKIREAASLIREALENGVSLRGMKVPYARIILLAMDWQYVTRLLPRDTNFFLTSGWLRSLRAGRPVDASGAPVPWYTYPAIDFLETLVDRRWHVLEWGGGNSTLWWASRVTSVTTVEDNRKWHDEIAAAAPDSVELLFRDTENDFVNAPLELGRKEYDVVVVDGSWRSACMELGLRLLGPRGILIFDNTDKRANREVQEMVTGTGMYRIDFWGLIATYAYKNCTSVYFRDASMLQGLGHPDEHVSSVGISAQQAVDRLLGAK